jgi:hypothetical protein
MVIDFPHPPRKEHSVEYIRVTRDGNTIIAMVGPDLEVGLGGFGQTIPEALQNLADNMEKEHWQSRVVE